MLKRVALIVGSIVGISLLRKKARQQQAEQELWNEATDDIRAPGQAPAPAPAADQELPQAQA